MKIAIATLKSEAPYSQSRCYDREVPKLDKGKELPQAYDDRTWRHRMHVTTSGHVEIPPMAFANCVKQACKRLRLKVPGKNGSEWTKYFEAGIMVTEALVLKVKAADVKGETLFVPSNGVRGNGKRVWRTFPRIDEWAGRVRFFVLDDQITPEVFVPVLESAGALVGIGRFRPENCGFYGRFSVASVDWLEDEAAMRAMRGAA